MSPCTACGFQGIIKPIMGLCRLQRPLSGPATTTTHDGRSEVWLAASGADWSRNDPSCIIVYFVSLQRFTGLPLNVLKV